jgi:hypothetical protein
MVRVTGNDRLPPRDGKAEQGTMRTPKQGLELDLVVTNDALD